MNSIKLIKIILAIIIMVLLLVNPLALIILAIYYGAISYLWQRDYINYINLIIAIVLCVSNLGRCNLVKLLNMILAYIHLLYHYNTTVTIFEQFELLTDIYPDLINDGLVGVMGLFMLGVCILQLLERCNKQGISILQQPINDGLELGVASDNKLINLSDQELNQHTLVLGTTGSGKTTTLLNIVKNCVVRGLPLIYIDGKGSVDLAHKISSLCVQYGRKLKVFTLDPSPLIPNVTPYNPLAFGSFTEWKNKIITLATDAETKGQEHYQLEENSYINLVCEILYKSQRDIDFEGVLGYLKHPEELQKLANKVDPLLAQRLVLSKGQDSSDLIRILEMFYYSHYGHLFSTTGQNSIINLAQSIQNGEIILFLLDAASYKKDTTMLGRLVINDINSAWAGFGRQGLQIKGYCIFDEFAAYASPNMANILSMQRSNGLHAVVGTQSINAISTESNMLKRVAGELIANCNTFIIHKLNDPRDLELLAKTIGTESKLILSGTMRTAAKELQVQTKMSHEFILDPQLIRELPAGYAYVCRTAINIKPQKVKINYI